MQDLSYLYLLGMCLQFVTSWNDKTRFRKRLFMCNRSESCFRVTSHAVSTCQYDMNWWIREIWMQMLENLLVVADYSLLFSPRFVSTICFALSARTAIGIPFWKRILKETSRRHDGFDRPACLLFGLLFTDCCYMDQ